MKFLLNLSLIVFVFIGCNNKKNLSEIDNPASEISSLPKLYTDNTGTIFMSWVEENESSASLKFSSFNGEVWSYPETIESDSTWFLNWADFPSIIGYNGKPMAAHWLNKMPGGTYSYNIQVAGFSQKDTLGKNLWSEPIIPHNDNTATEHGFVSMVPASDSTFLMVWLDGRNTAGRGHHEYSDLSKAMTLRAAFVSENGEVMEEFELDDAVCDCCNTSITKTNDGFMVAYRNRTDDEIRDINVISYSDGAWSQPKAVHSDNWKISACPVNGPAIDSHKNYAAVAWFTGAGGEAFVKMSISLDYGKSFQKPILIDNNNPTGRVDVNFGENNIWLSWIGEIENENALKIRSLNFEGKTLADHAIRGISQSRSSGFPQITPFLDNLLIAYTDISGEEPILKTAIIN